MSTFCTLLSMSHRLVSMGRDGERECAVPVLPGHVTEYLPSDVVLYPEQLSKVYIGGAVHAV